MSNNINSDLSVEDVLTLSNEVNGQIETIELLLGESVIMKKDEYKKLKDNDENELVILDEDLYKISTDAAQESIEILVNKTITEKQEEIEKLIQSAQTNTNGFQQNRRRNKKNV